MFAEIEQQNHIIVQTNKMVSFLLESENYLSKNVY